MALIDSKQLNPRFTGSFILSGSTQTFIGSSDFQGSVTASGDISASGTIFADTFQSTGGDVDGISFTDDLNLSGNFTASGDISGSGNIFGTGNLDIDGTSNLEGNVTLQNDLSVSGNITGSNDISASGNLSATGNLDIDGTSNLASDLFVGGNITGSNDISASGDIYGTGNLDIDGTTNLQGNATLQGDIDVDGTTNLDNTDIDGTLTVDGTNTTITSTIVSLVGAVTASSNVSSSGNLSATGNLDIDGTSNFAGNVTMQNDLSVTGNITGSSNLEINGNISGSATSTGSFGRLEIAGNSNLVGNLTLGGNITIGDADTDSIAITADLSSSLIPNADITYDLGSPSRRYQFGYLESISTTNVTASGDLSVESTGSIGKLVAGDITEEIFVTVINTSEGNRYAFEGEITPDFTIDEGKSYRFDQSDASNGGHPLKFSLTENGIHPGGTEYTAGVVSSSVAQGSAGSYIELRVDKNTSNYLYYYCINHGNMGADARLLKNDLTNLHFVSGSSASSASFGRVEADAFAGDGADLTNVTDPSSIAMAIVFGG